MKRVLKIFILLTLIAIISISAMNCNWCNSMTKPNEKGEIIVVGWKKGFGESPAMWVADLKKRKWTQLEVEGQ